MANRKNEEETLLRKELKGALEEKLGDPNKSLEEIIDEIIELKHTLKGSDKATIEAERQKQTLQMVIYGSSVPPLPAELFPLDSELADMLASKYEPLDQNEHNRKIGFRILGIDEADYENHKAEIDANRVKRESEKKAKAEAKTKAEAEAKARSKAMTYGVEDEQRPVTKSGQMLMSNDIGATFKRESEQLTLNKELYGELAKVMQAMAGSSGLAESTSKDSITTFLEVGSSIADLIAILEFLGITSGEAESGLVGLGKAVGKYAKPLAILAATMVGVGLVADVVDKRVRSAITTDLNSRFGNLSLSMDELNEIARRTLTSGNIKNYAKAFQSFGELESAKQFISDTREELEKLQYRLSLGLELTVEEQGEYQKGMDDYFVGVEKAIWSQHESTLDGLKAALSPEEFESHKDSLNENTQRAVEFVRAKRKEVSDAFENNDPNAYTIAAEAKDEVLPYENALNSKKSSRFDEVTTEYFNPADFNLDTFTNYLEALRGVGKEYSDGVREAQEKTLENLNQRVVFAELGVVNAKGTDEEGKANEVLAEAIKARDSYEDMLNTGKLEYQVQEPNVLIGQQVMDAFVEAFPIMKDILNSKTQAEADDLWRSVDPKVQMAAKEIFDLFGDTIPNIDEFKDSCSAAGEKIPIEAENLSDSLRKLSTTMYQLHKYVVKPGGYIETDTGLILPSTPIPMAATGTPHTPNTFIAGEKGAELITNMPGMTVYNAMETGRILKSFKGLNASAMVGQPNAMRTSSKALPDLKLAPLGENTYKIDSNLNITVNGDIPGDLEQQLARHENRIIARVREEIKSDERNKGRRSLA